MLGLDPGSKKSGWAITKGGYFESAGILSNEDILAMIDCNQQEFDLVAIEMIENQHNVVGSSVFQTCRWVGRFEQMAVANLFDVTLIERKMVKKFVCRTYYAGDKHIRARMVALFGAPGTKKNPGPTYGVTSHAWQALAVAVTANGCYLRN